MWSGVVTGKYKTGKSLPHPALKKLNSEHNFKAMSSETQQNQKPPLSAAVMMSNHQNEPNPVINKLIRSRTYFEYTRRYSTSSSESQNSSGSKRSNGSGPKRGGGSGGQMKPPLLPSSPRGFNSSYKRKNSLSGAGRGTLASIKAETSVDLPDKSDNETTASRKPMFY